MTLREIITQRPNGNYRRALWHKTYHVYIRHEMLFYCCNDEAYTLSLEDVISDDWEVKKKLVKKRMEVRPYKAFDRIFLNAWIEGSDVKETEYCGPVQTIEIEVEE